MITNLLFENQQIEIHCLIFLVTTISDTDVPLSDNRLMSSQFADQNRVYLADHVL